MPPEPTPGVRFAPQQCPDCGYALHGLPPAGICPECGAPYDPGQIILYGWAGPTKSRMANSRSGPAIAGAIAAAAVLLCLAFVYRRRVGWEGIVAAAALAAGMAAIVYHRRSLGTPPVQVRLQPEGVAQRDGVGPVALEPWQGRWELHLVPNGTGRRRLILYRLKGGRWTTVLQPVDLDFECDPERAKELGRRVHSYVAAAGGEVRTVIA